MERMRLIEAHRSGCYRVGELASRFGVSRPTVYKWLARFDGGGAEALLDRGHARRGQAAATAPQTETLLLDVRRAHPTWGPRKVIHFLARERPDVHLPAPSTVGALYTRHGLTQHRRARRRPVHPGASPLEAAAPNDVWSADFKGQFKTGDGRYCYTLTVCDAHSRYILDCRAMLEIGLRATHDRFQRLFDEYGLPAAIRTDNGVPFAAPALHGLTRLSVGWIKLGIRHQRIDPGRPQQNGRHERMHRTLKAETTRPPGANAALQQRRFDAWRAHFNGSRPHAALDGATPASLYAPARRLPSRIPPEPNYPGHFERRRVSTAGSIKLRGRDLFLARALAGETVALDEVDDGLWGVYFYDVLLARFHEPAGVLVP
jgi:transposase InsO family protein